MSGPSPSSPSHGKAPESQESGLLAEMEAQRRRADVRRQASSTQAAAASFLSNYASRRFMQGCAVLFPILLTLYLTFWIVEFFDGFFSPLYAWLFGFRVFGLGFTTSMLFIFGTGVFASSWAGSALVGLGELIIRKVPLMKHIYSAAKQISAAVSPDNAANSFRECVVIRHPRSGEYALAFITGQTTLVHADGREEELFSVFHCTNHVYLGDIYLLAAKDIIRSNLTVRDGIEIVVSVGMALPQRIVGT